MYDQPIENLLHPAWSSTVTWRNIARSWKGVGTTPVAWHFTCDCTAKGWPTCLRLRSTRKFLVNSRSTSR